MFLNLAHTRLDVFQESKALVLECYNITKGFPTEEKFSLVQQIRRAALSVHLNIAEGCSRKSEPERKRFFEIARGSAIEVDTALDVAVALGFCTITSLDTLGQKLLNTFKMLSGLMNSKIANSQLTTHQ